MEILLIGPPGCGKGTQGSRLADRFAVRHIAVGDLLRAEVAAETSLGNRVREIMARGDLVPDAVILDLVIPVVEDAYAAGGFVLDGFPRTVPQAVEAKRLFMRYLAQREEERHAASAVLYLDVPRSVLTDRLIRRAQLDGRSDDTAEVIARRLTVFEEATLPLVNHFRGLGRLRVVEAAGAVDEVTKRLTRALGYAA